jgi:hypothetical protein
MAEVVPIQGTSDEGKKRNVLAPIGLSIITLGIYGIVWYYKTNKELAEIGKANGTDELGDSPMTSVLAVTIGAIVIVPALVSRWNTWQRQHKAAVLLGREDVAFNPVAGFILDFLVVGSIVFQSGQNKILDVQAQVGPGTAAAPLAPPPPPVAPAV